jgi:hypothetical protein
MPAFALLFDPTRRQRKAVERKSDEELFQELFGETVAEERREGELVIDDVKVERPLEYTEAANGNKITVAVVASVSPPLNATKCYLNWLNTYNGDRIPHSGRQITRCYDQ